MRGNRMMIRKIKREMKKRELMKKLNKQKKNLLVLSILVFFGITIPPRGNYRKSKNRQKKIRNNYRYAISYNNVKNDRKINRIIKKGRTLN